MQVLENNNLNQNNELDYVKITNQLMVDILRDLKINVAVDDPIIVQYFVNQKILQENLKVQNDFLAKITKTMQAQNQTKQNYAENEGLINEIKAQINDLRLTLKDIPKKGEEEKYFNIIHDLFEKIAQTNNANKKVLQENTLQIKAALIEANNLDNLESTPILKKLNLVAQKLDWTFKTIACASLVNFLLIGIFWFWLFK